MSKIIPSEVFENLKTLIGNWNGTISGKVYEVSYKLIASDSVLVESWILAPGSEAMTVYHMNESDLIATHYCPQCNQPRLQLQSELKNGRFNFKFFDGTNIDASAAYHQHQFDLLILSDREFVRGEMYLCNKSGKSNYESVNYFRI